LFWPCLGWLDSSAKARLTTHSPEQAGPRLLDDIELGILSKFAESLDRLPDSQQLKLIKDTLTVAERVSQSAPELDQVISLIKEINSVSPEKLRQIDKLLRQIQKIMKTAPEGILEFISSLSDEEKPKL